MRRFFDSFLHRSAESFLTAALQNVVKSMTTAWSHLQSSTCNPGTRTNSIVLLVTKVAPKLSA
jgi:hypothetical protein